RPRTMALVFFAIVGLAGFFFSIYPTTLMPLEDQGYCIVVAELPPGAAQPRVRDVSASMDAILRDTPGIKGWVSIGGYSALDSAKLSTIITTFAIYQDWNKRPPGVTQQTILLDLQDRFGAIRKATFAVLPPSPIPGLGTAFGFDMMVEDRAGA